MSHCVRNLIVLSTTGKLLRKSLVGIEWTLMPNSSLTQTDCYNCSAHVCYNYSRLINEQVPLKMNMDD